MVYVNNWMNKKEKIHENYASIQMLKSVDSEKLTGERGNNVKINIGF